ncbi:MAG: hypothetical protein AAGG01_06720, partial [Planctomycetota bacterium]
MTSAKGWNEIEPPKSSAAGGHPAQWELPAFLFRSKVQNARSDALDLGAFDRLTLQTPESGALSGQAEELTDARLLALADNGAEAVYHGGGPVLWRTPGVAADQTSDAIPTKLHTTGRPVSLCLDPPGSHITIASAHGKLDTYLTGQLEPQSCMLPVPAAVVGSAREGGAKEGPFGILVAGLDHSLTRYDWIGQQRAHAAWRNTLHTCLERLGTSAESWREWFHEDPEEPPDPLLRLLLWLHVAWDLEPSLLDSFCELARSRTWCGAGASIGRAVARLCEREMSRDHAVPRTVREKARRIRDAVGWNARVRIDEVLAPEKLDDTVWTCAEESASDSTGEFWRMDAQGRLATSPYAQEPLLRHAGEFVGVLQSAVQTSSRKERLILAGRQTVDAIEVLPDRTTRSLSRPIPGDAFSREPGRHQDQGSHEWRTLRSVEIDGNRVVTALGSLAGDCTLLSTSADGEIRTARWSGQSNARFLGALSLDRRVEADGSMRFGMVHALGPRVVIEEVYLDLETAELTSEPSARSLIPVPATSVDSFVDLETPVIAAGTRSHTVHWLRPASSEKGWEEFASESVDGAVAFVRCAIGGREDENTPLVLVGTRTGSLWCFVARTRTLRWVRDLEGSPVAIDVTGRGASLRVAACTTANLVLLLDEHGRLIWRHRLSRPPRDVALIPDPATRTPSRIAVIEEGQRLVMFRRTSPVDLDAVFQAAGPPAETARDDVPEVFRAAHWISGSEPVDPRVVQSFQRRNVRRILLRALAGQPSAVDETQEAGAGEQDKTTALGQALHSIDYNAIDLLVAAQSLNLEAPHPRWRDIWRGLTRCLDDLDDEADVEVRAVLDQAACELFGALRYARATRSMVVECSVQIENALRKASSRARASEPFESRHWYFRRQAAHAWLNALNVEVEAGAGAVLGTIHELSPRTAAEVALLLPRGPLAAWIGRIAYAAIHETTIFSVDRSTTASLELGGLGHREKEIVALETMWSVVRSALDLGSSEHGDFIRSLEPAVQELLKASRAVDSGAGPIIGLLRGPGIEMSSPPDRSEPVHVQRTRLTNALSQGWQNQPAQSAAEAEPESSDPWSDLAARSLNQVEEVARRFVIARLQETVTLTRARIAAEPLGWTGDSLSLSLRAEHEGAQPLTDVSVGVQFHADDPNHTLLASIDNWRFTQLAPGDPARYRTTSVSVPPWVIGLLVRVKTRSGNHTVDETTLKIPLKRRVSGQPDQRSPVLLSPILDALATRVSSTTRSITVVALDDLLQPAAVAVRLTEELLGIAVSLDGPLFDEEGETTTTLELTSQMILRTMAGWDPRDGEDQDVAVDWAGPGSSSGALILFPCQRVLGALLRREHPKVASEVFDALRANALRRAGRRLVVLLPSGLASQLHGRLGNDHAAFVHAGQVKESELSPQLYSAVAGHLSLTSKDARRRLRKAGFDLRVLADPNRIEAWIRADVQGLSSAEVMTLVALTRAESEVPVVRVPEHAIAAETIQSVTVRPGNVPKRLLTKGEAVGSRTSLAGVRSRIKIRGLWQQDISSFPGEERRLILLAGQL